MSKEQRVINYYVICNKLKYIIRKGWEDWNVESDRLESLAEHIFGTQMLALAMKSQYEEYKDIDITKVILMIALHELGKAYSGDNNKFYLSKEYRQFVEHHTVHDLLCHVIDYKALESLYLEYEEGESREAQFAIQCDKLESDLQCKLYDEECNVSLREQSDNKALKDSQMKQLYDEESTWSAMWIKYDQQQYNYDKNFDSVSQYTMQNDIKKRNRH